MDRNSEWGWIEKPLSILITVLVLIVLRLLWLGFVEIFRWALYAWYGESPESDRPRRPRA